MRQGCSLGSAGYCVGIHPEVRELDEELRASGGAARFDMDDGYAVGPPELVFPAVLRFARRVAALGLELQLHKCTCCAVAADLAAHPARPKEVAVGSMTLPDGVGGLRVGSRRRACG